MSMQRWILRRIKLLLLKSTFFLTWQQNMQSRALFKHIQVVEEQLLQYYSFKKNKRNYKKKLCALDVEEN